MTEVLLDDEWDVVEELVAIVLVVAEEVVVEMLVDTVLPVDVLAVDE